MSFTVGQLERDQSLPLVDAEVRECQSLETTLLKGGVVLTISRHISVPLTSCLFIMSIGPYNTCCAPCFDAG